MIKELQKFRDFNEVTSLDNLFSKRLFLEQAMSELKEIKKELDATLIYEMKKRNIKSFNAEICGMKNIVAYGEKIKEKIINPVKLQEMLFDGSDTEKELAKKAIGLSASSWKVAQVKVLCDTIGLDRSDFIDVTPTDEIEVKVIPIEILKNKGVI